MGIEESVKFFGSGNKLCKALGLTRQNLTDWRRKGYIPMIQQMRLERVTGGKLKSDKEQADE